MRVAFTLIGGKKWTGGYNYLLNLTTLLSLHRREVVTPVIFVGTRVPLDELKAFAGLKGVEVVRTPLMEPSRKLGALVRGVILGHDSALVELFRKHEIDVVFEAAMFYGWRFSLPVLAWLPDFQHRYLRRLFSISAWLKRELSIQAQVASGRRFMLSSEDARRSCEKFYPRTLGRTQVVRFAVPPPPLVGIGDARELARGYGLPESFVFMPNQFWMHKNHLLVVEALALLRDGGHEVVIAAPGRQVDPRDPDYFRRVREAVDHLKLQHEFRFLGMIPYHHLAILLRASVGLLNPSTFEGWSTTVEEARAQGAPMLLSDIAVHREQAGSAASYFDPASAASLAEALLTFRPLSESVRQTQAFGAQRDAHDRATRFAHEFVSVVDLCMRS